MGKEDQHDPVEEQEQEDQTPENQVPEQDEEQQTPDVTANEGQSGAIEIRSKQADDDEDIPEIPERSEERRVGKECRTGGAAYREQEMTSEAKGTSRAQ